MKYIRIVFYIVALLAISYVQVHAATPQAPAASGTPTVITWIAPTLNTDLSALTDLAGFKLYHRLAPQTTYDPPVLISAVSQSYTYNPIGDGTHFYAISAYNTAGTESAKSAEVSVARASVTVNVTTNPRVGTDTKAYRMRQAVDSYSFVAFGSVPTGTACDPAHLNDGFMLVPRATVTLTNKFDTFPTLTWAKCQ